MKYKLEVSSIYKQGKRENQEDCIFPAAGQENTTDRLFILCDGMGGHEAGEVASQTVCEAMSKYILEKCQDAEGMFTNEDLLGAVKAGFDALDLKIDDEKPQSKKMGTTMTCLKLHTAGYTIAHMGDSRVYHIRPDETGDDTKIVYVTHDHSLVNDLVAIGELTEEEARHSKQKNVITRAMQPRMERRPTPDIYTSDDVRPGDYFMLCSDGMLEMLTDKNLCYRFSNQMEKGANKKAENLLVGIEEEIQDNHSAIIVHILDVIEEEKQNTDSGKARLEKESQQELSKMNDDNCQLTEAIPEEQFDVEVEIEQLNDESSQAQPKTKDDKNLTNNEYCFVVKLKDFVKRLFGIKIESQEDGDVSTS